MAFLNRGDTGGSKLRKDAGGQVGGKLKYGAVLFETKKPARGTLRTETIAPFFSKIKTPRAGILYDATGQKRPLTLCSSETRPMIIRLPVEGGASSAIHALLPAA